MVGVLLEGRYRVERRLASGGMSQVYVGHDERLDRPVAIKVMNADLAADPAFIARFTREARAAARILHPNIVTVHDQGTDDAHAAVYLVMELVNGGTLRDLLRRQDRLDVGAALAVLEPLLTGLAAAHAEGLVHRDIKPENILIDSRGRVLVADFGLARAVAQSSHTTHSGKSGAVFGTIAYLSPEQVTKGRADARSDVYAVGILLYEMLTGAPPYVGDNAVSVAYRHVNDDVPPPSEEVPEVPGEVDDLVIAATTRDPLKRPADAGQMLALVRQARRSLAVDAEPVPVPRAPRALELSGDEDRTGRTVHVAAGDLSGARDTREQPDDPSDDDLSDDDGAGPLAAASGRAIAAEEQAGQRAGQQPGPDDEIAVLPDRRRPRRRALVPLLLVVALIAGAGFWWMQWGRWTQVPDFASAQSRQQVAELAGEAGVDVILKEPQFSETVPDGAPIEVDPDAGTRVTRGADVTIVLSKGPERYVVDEDYVGQPANEVVPKIQALLDDRVGLEVVADYSETVPKDHVAAFSPAPGTALRPGETLQVTISQGRAPIPIPDVAGQSPDAATTALTDAGFSPTVSLTQEFSDEKAGTVARTDPAAGTQAQPGAGVAITIVVSKGPDLVQVPSVTGKSTAEATDLLEAAGFKVEVTTVFTTLGLVAVQSPAGGSTAKRGSTVTLKVV